MGADFEFSDGNFLNAEIAEINNEAPPKKMDINELEASFN